MNNSEKRAQLEKFKQVRSLATELQKTPYPFDMFVEIKEAELAKEEELPSLIEYFTKKFPHHPENVDETLTEWLSKLTAKIEGMKLYDTDIKDYYNVTVNKTLDKVISIIKP